jgi:hypothetical protein
MTVARSMATSDPAITTEMTNIAAKKTIGPVSTSGATR